MPDDRVWIDEAGGAIRRLFCVRFFQALPIRNGCLPDGPLSYEFSLLRASLGFGFAVQRETSVQLRR